MKRLTQGLALITICLAAVAGLAGDKKVTYNKLNPEEQRVILHKDDR